MKTHGQRRQIAFEAARLMAREGHTDVGRARHKAAERLGITDKASQPDEGEILQQLREYQRLHGSPEHDDAVRSMRLAAIEAMAFFKHFQPRIAGSVLEGTAHPHSPVLLHLHSDDAESVPRFLVDASIPALARFRRLRKDGEHNEDFPVWTFTADGQAFELVVLPEALLRQAPLDTDGRPMRRASLASLRAMVTENSAFDGELQEF